MSSFTIIYDANGASKGTMSPTKITYGVPTKISANQYIREGYTFIGWTARRKSDNKTCYENPETKERRFFSWNEQPAGWRLYVYKNSCSVAKLSKVDGDIVTMSAGWERKEGLVAAPSQVVTNKEIIEDYLTYRNIVLFGGSEECINFYKKYNKQIYIHKIFSDDGSEFVDEIDGRTVKVESFKKEKLEENDYIVICRQAKVRLDEKYKAAKDLIKKTGRVITKDFLRADVAEMILSKKKLWVWFGYCQLETLRNDVLSAIPQVTENYVMAGFRYELNTTKKSYKYEDCVELLKLCDILMYVPLVVTQDKMDFTFDELAPLDAKRVTIPRIPFRGYYPWRNSNLETFHKFSVDGKLHWPFAYEEKIIDDLVLAGKSDDEIYEELMREDLIAPEVIKKNLKLAFKFIEISESTTDIKMLDFIKENFKKRLVYRDGLHYQNFMYFEMARQMCKILNIDCEQEIAEVEKRISEKGRQLIDYTEVPILPCVVKALELDFITDDTLYRVRTTEKGAWRGTKAYIKKMNRKDWIYAYAKYTRACITLCEYWNVEIEK